MTVTLDAIEEARQRIAGAVVRTPLLRLEGVPPGREVFLKLENLQPINSFKLRGALNAVALLLPEQRAYGVWTASAGNAGQGLAYAARAIGVPCTVVAPDTAPKTKIERMRALGARVMTVPFDSWWQAMERQTFPGVEGTFISPFDNDAFIAGNATLALEILDELPHAQTVIAPIGGGGLLAGVASAIRQRNAAVKIYGAEPETAAPVALSFERGEASAFPNWQPSFVDGAGGKRCFPQMFERLKPIVDGVHVVTLQQTREAMRILAQWSRVIAEGAGALAVAAALDQNATHLVSPIVAVVSGGNIELSTFCEVVGT